MAVIQYKCNVCKREIDLVENQKGLEVMNRCIITEGCRGELYRINRLEDFIRGQFPDRVPGLDDYTQRRVLYNHTQSIPSTEWFVEHNLGVAPSVQVLIDIAAESTADLSETPCALVSVEDNFIQVEITDFDVTITSPNTLTITFDDPRSGLAQMIARSSAPVVFEESVEAETPVFQLTSTGSLLTIATRNSTIPQGSSVDIEIDYIPPGSLTPITKTYTVPITTISDSPWNDFTNVLIQGKIYRVRSFDTFVSEMSDGTIPDGSTFYFKSVNSRDIDSREIIILLALSPYENVDKIKDRIIDVSTVTAQNASLSFFHTDRELFTFTPIILSTFPPLREV